MNLKNLNNQDKKQISEEVKLCKKLNHPNIVHFIAAWTTPAQLVLITELLTGGSLKQYISKIKHPRLKVIKIWCKGILEGLDYLHSQKPFPIIHRDLKCDNIFIMSNTGDVKIGDFGLSTIMRKSMQTSVLGTPHYMAPELFEGSYDTRVDVYSFGMCLLEMSTLSSPYEECSNFGSLYKKVLSKEPPQSIWRIEDEEIRSFITLCISPSRPTSTELLNHPFLVIDESDPKEHLPVSLSPKNTDKATKNSQVSIVIKPCQGPPKEVKFEYTQEDTPESLAEEMVQELGLSQALVIPIAQEIEAQIQKSPRKVILEGPCPLNGTLTPLSSLQKHSENNKDHVLLLQRTLSSNMGTDLKLDGHFDDSTESCVKEFQRLNGVPSDGIVTQEMWDLLLNPSY